jgi:hypothetical protein
MQHIYKTTNMEPSSQQTILYFKLLGCDLKLGLYIEPARLVTARLVMARLVNTLARLGSLYKRASRLPRAGSFGSRAKSSKYSTKKT